MAALRFASPDHETRFLDLGPAPARHHHGAHDARPVENVGQMVPIMGLPQSTTPARQAQMKAYKAERKHRPTPFSINSDSRKCRHRTTAERLCLLPFNHAGEHAR